MVVGESFGRGSRTMEVQACHEMRHLQTSCMIWRGTPNRNNERFNPKFDHTQDIANCITTKLEMHTTMQDLPSGMTAYLEPLENPNLDN